MFHYSRYFLLSLSKVGTVNLATKLVDLCGWLVVFSSTVLHTDVRLKCAAVTMVYSDLSEGKNNSGVAARVCWAPTTVNRPGIRR